MDTYSAATVLRQAFPLLLVSRRAHALGRAGTTSFFRESLCEPTQNEASRKVQMIFVWMDRRLKHRRIPKTSCSSYNGLWGGKTVVRFRNGLLPQYSFYDLSGFITRSIQFLHTDVYTKLKRNLRNKNQYIHMIDYMYYNEINTNTPKGKSQGLIPWARKRS